MSGGVSQPKRRTRLLARARNPSTRIRWRQMDSGSILRIAPNDGGWVRQKQPDGQITSGTSCRENAAHTPTLFDLLWARAASTVEKNCNTMSASESPVRRPDQMPKGPAQAGRQTMRVMVFGKATDGSEKSAPPHKRGVRGDGPVH